MHRPHRDELLAGINGVAVAPAPREDTGDADTAGDADDELHFDPEVRAALLNRVTGELVCIYLCVFSQKCRPQAQTPRADPWRSCSTS